MGLFSRKKNKPDKNKKEKVNATNVFLEDGLTSADMVSIVNKEQKESLNSFAKDAKGRDFNPNAKSVAKSYGFKYVGASGQQLASSKVVDVRSYKKTVQKPVSAINDDLLDDFDNGEDELKSVAPSKTRSSFFDELMKEHKKKEKEEKLEQEQKPIKITPSKVEPKAVVKKKKKSVDIDIISGDFGGIDIM